MHIPIWLLLFAICTIFFNTMWLIRLISNRKPVPLTRKHFMDELNDYHYEILKERLLNKQVIVITNSPGLDKEPNWWPISTGTCTNIIRITQAQNPVPVIVINGEEKIAMGPVLIFNDAIFQILETIARYNKHEVFEFVKNNYLSATK